MGTYNVSRAGLWLCSGSRNLICIISVTQQPHKNTIIVLVYREGASLLGFTAGLELGWVEGMEPEVACAAPLSRRARKEPLRKVLLLLNSICLPPPEFRGYRPSPIHQELCSHPRSPRLSFSSQGQGCRGGRDPAQGGKGRELCWPLYGLGGWKGTWPGKWAWDP